MTPSRPAEIYYTTDNSTPYASSIKYTGPIIINTTTTLRYIAIDSDGIASEAYYKVYVVDSDNSLTFDNAVGNLHERTGSQDLTFILKTGNWDQIVTVLDQVTKQINLDGSI